MVAVCRRFQSKFHSNFHSISANSTVVPFTLWSCFVLQCFYFAEILASLRLSHSQIISDKILFRSQNSLSTTRIGTRVHDETLIPLVLRYVYYETSHSPFHFYLFSICSWQFNVLVADGEDRDAFYTHILYIFIHKLYNVNAKCERIARKTKFFISSFGSTVCVCTCAFSDMSFSRVANT